jgi:hypothetical protein
VEYRAKVSFGFYRLLDFGGVEGKEQEAWCLKSQMVYT